MKRTLKLTAMAAIVWTLSNVFALAEGKLEIYNWYDYIPQELLDKFSAETGIEVILETYDSNEALLASLKAGGVGSYDVAIPSDYMVKIMADSGLLDTIGENELSNRANIEDQWLDVPFDPGRKHSIPYQWGSTSFSVNRDVYKGDINTTDIIFDPPPELSGKINLMDSQGEVFAFASLHMGIPQCSTDRDQLKALNEMMQKAKPHWASINSDIVKEVLVSGDAYAGMIWNGYSARGREEGANIEYAFPKQGYVLWMDSVVLLKDAPNRANAIKFLDFLLLPENVAQVSNYTKYYAGVKNVKPLLDEDLANLPESNPPATAGKGEFVAVCDEETQKVYEQIWTNLKK